MELRYRPQQYSHRFVNNDEDKGLRRDKRWLFSLNGSFALGRYLELLPAYRFETRSSNDPEKEFDAHVAYVGLRYWFGRGGNPTLVRRRPTQPPALAAKKEEPKKGDTASLSPGRSKALPAPVSRSGARTPSRRPAATSSAASPVVSPARAAQASNEKWSKRAEADRQRLVRGDAGRYAIELDIVCGGARFLEEAWRHDSRAGTMWLIRSESPCYRVFWGHFSSQHDTERALHTIPESFRSGSRRPFVVLLAAGSAMAEGNGPSR